MGDHDGHRERMKDRFAEHGLDNFSEHNVLELLLFYAIPRKDVNLPAHNLIERFGSLAGVFEAQVSELEKTPGLGRNAAVLLKLIPQINRRYFMSKGASVNIIDSSAAAGEFFIPLFMYEKDEAVYAACFDSKFKLTGYKRISEGTVNAADINIRKIVEFALEKNAVSVILAHNHTSGGLTPSAPDERATAQIKKALEFVGITLADHIIVAGENYVSMSDIGLINK
ncbi:MAG: hypothetical protein FWG32_06520 [Oscillospiraceae bacterium]|nr:hypothetical protein [Oscillospiraceae bacterium]